MRQGKGKGVHQPAGNRAEFVDNDHRGHCQNSLSDSSIGAWKAAANFAILDFSDGCRSDRLNRFD
ncbi:hypothetical protein [Bradyrhizobium sp. USDA 4454]